LADLHGHGLDADKGGEWRELREMVKTLNQAMRQHREVLRKLAQ
jgi:hypothetical protein